MEITREQYEALLNLARQQSPEQTQQISDLIDRVNGITRYHLHLRWQDVGGQPPPRIELGKGWPVETTIHLVQDRPFASSDVDEFFENNTINPVTIHVTKDPNGELGWYELNAFPW